MLAKLIKYSLSTYYFAFFIINIHNMLSGGGER